MTEHAANCTGSAEYDITSISNVAVFITFLAGMCSIFIAGAIALATDWELKEIATIVLIGIVFVIFFLRFLLVRLLAQKMVVTLLKDGMDVRYLYKPFFDGVGNTFVHITDIKSYQVGTHPAPGLTIELHNNRKLRFAAPNIGDKGQLAALVTAFAEMMERRGSGSATANFAF